MCMLTIVNQISFGTIYQRKKRRTSKVIFGHLSDLILLILSYAIVKHKLSKVLYS